MSLQHAVIFERTGNNRAKYAFVLHGCTAAGRSLEDTGRGTLEVVEAHVQILRQSGEPVPASTSLVGQVELSGAARCSLRLGPNE